MRKCCSDRQILCLLSHTQQLKCTCSISMDPDASRRHYV